jgi:hypothetical protein
LEEPMIAVAAIPDEDRNDAFGQKGEQPLHL